MKLLVPETLTGSELIKIIAICVHHIRNEAVDFNDI